MKLTGAVVSMASLRNVPCREGVRRDVQNRRPRLAGGRFGSRPFGWNKEPDQPAPPPQRTNPQGFGILIFPLKSPRIGEVFIFYKHIAHVTQKVETSFVFLRGK